MISNILQKHSKAQVLGCFKSTHIEKRLELVLYKGVLVLYYLQTFQAPADRTPFDERLGY